MRGGGGDKKEEIHNYNAIFCSNAAEMYSWRINKEEKNEEVCKDEEKEEEEEITTAMQSSSAMQQSCTRGQGDCFLLSSDEGRGGKCRGKGGGGRGEK